MRISSTRMEPLMIPVTIIQRSLFVAFLIFPDESNVESSNMASLESGVLLLSLRHRGSIYCSQSIKTAPNQRASHLYQTTPGLAKDALQSGQVERRAE